MNKNEIKNLIVQSRKYIKKQKLTSALLKMIPYIGDSLEELIYGDRIEELIIEISKAKAIGFIIF